MPKSMPFAQHHNCFLKAELWMSLNIFHMSMGIYEQNSFHDRLLDIILILWIEIYRIRCESFQWQSNIKKWKAACNSCQSQKRMSPWSQWSHPAAAAAAAKSRQSCPTLCDPIDSSPPGSRPWDSPGKNTGVGCHFFSSAWKWKIKVKLLSCVRLLVTPWTAAHQAPPSMGFPRQEYWSGVPLPSPRAILALPNSTFSDCIQI